VDGFEVLTAVNMKTLLLVVWFFPVASLDYFSALKMEVKCSIEKSV
jgi:hypothetical protein